ncbi:MAG: hypothetical protein WKF61_05645 [Luteimonas sp.]
MRHGFRETATVEDTSVEDTSVEDTSVEDMSVEDRSRTESGLDTRIVGRFEQLPKWLNLIPMVAQWLWLGLRYRSVTLPSAANPRITAGGMVGEGKLEYFDIMGSLARASTAEHIGVRVEASTTADATVSSRWQTWRLRSLV